MSHPLTKPPVATGVVARVCEDLARRQIKRPLPEALDLPMPLRAVINNAYGATLDQAIRWKQQLEELDSKEQEGWL